MTAKFSASADGTKVYVGNASENALEIDATGKTIKPVAPYAFGGLGNFVNDAAAATGGVPVGGMYHTAGAVKVRVT